jgi:hypothetical protein
MARLVELLIAGPSEMPMYLTVMLMALSAAPSSTPPARAIAASGQIGRRSCSKKEGLPSRSSGIQPVRMVGSVPASSRPTP